MDAEDLIDLWPDGAVKFSLTRYAPNKWCADLHTYGTTRSVTTIGRTAAEAIAELHAKVAPTPPAPTTTDYDDLI